MYNRQRASYIIRMLTILCGAYYMGTWILYDYLKIHFFIVWNLFLALLPLYFSYTALFFMKKSCRFRSMLSLLLWFLFFPNAPYMITDLLHLSRYTIYWKQTADLQVFLNWLGLVHLFLGIMLGLAAGYLSLYLIHAGIKGKYGRIAGLFLLFATSSGSGIAIYIGRFMRFNSWDVFFRPQNLAAAIAEDMSLLTAAFCLLFGAMTIVVYLPFWACMRINQSAPPAYMAIEENTGKEE